MKGKKGELPNPFSSVGVLENGKKCRLDLNDGHLVPFVLPEFSEVNTETGNISFSIDASQEKEIDKIVEKIVKRNFPNKKPQLNKSERVIQQIENLISIQIININIFFQKEIIKRSQCSTCPSKKIELILF